MSKNIAELSFDLHAGLSSFQVPEFEDIQVIGMAATLAVHIKGLGEIKYDVLRKVSDHFMSIPSIALEKVLRVLSEVGFVRLVESGRRIESIIPNIPVFQTVYGKLDNYATSECRLNEYEELTLRMLDTLQNAPQNRDSLQHKLGAESKAFDRCVVIGQASGIVSEHTARGRPILISPYYFADNLDGLADAAVSAGAEAIGTTLKKIKDNQGWPLSLVASSGEIGGVKLSSTEQQLVLKLSQEGIIRPPTIKFGLKAESFVFTPRPGRTRLNASNRNIYERAMALISAVRKGQLLPNAFRIKSPLAILQALRDRGFLRSNSEANEQYRNLVVLMVAFLKPVNFNRWQLHLHRTPENEAALDLAISLLRTGALANMEVDQEARLALSKDEEYVQSLISAREMKSRQKQIVDKQAEHEFEQLVLKLG